MAIAAPYYVLFIMKLLSFVKDTKIINEACLDLSLSLPMENTVYIVTNLIYLRSSFYSGGSYSLTLIL